LAPWPWEAIAPGDDPQLGLRLEPHVGHRRPPISQPMDGPGARVLIPSALDEAGLDALMAAAEATLGGLDAVIVVAAAIGATGRAQAPTAIADMALDHWRCGLDRGLKAPFLVLQRAVEAFLIMGNPGRIVLVTARDPWHPASAAARTGAHSLVRSIAREYGRRGILCNAIDLPPGDIACREWFAVADFLASPACGFTTGDIVSIAPSRHDLHPFDDMQGSLR
jgi:hypothetical protein